MHFGHLNGASKYLTLFLGALPTAVRGFREVFARFSRGFREVFARFSRGFREIFARFSLGFRKVFARFSLQNIFVKGSGEQKNKKIINFCVPRGPPPRGAAEPGPPRHAKIGKNHPNQSVRPQKKTTFFLFFCGTLSVVPSFSV